MGLLDKFLNNNNTHINSRNEVSVNMNIPTGSSYVDSSTPTVKVDEETALKIAGLNQGINIIGDTISSMPIFLYRNDEGFNEVFYNDSRSLVMSSMANITLSSFNLKKNLIKDIILYGNAYAKIVREGDAVSLVYLPTEVVVPKMDNTGYYYEIQSYSTEINGERYESEIIDDIDMLVLTRNNKYNSVQGTGLLEYAKDVLGLAVEESTYMLNLFRNGLSSKAMLTSKTVFRREVKEQLKMDLKEFYSGSANAGKIMVLEGDINVVPLAMTPTDIKLIENKHFTISEIARYLNISKHYLNLDRQQGTYTNATQERMALLQNTLMPYVIMIESAMNSKLLTPEEIAQGYYFSFDTSELLKLTPQDQASFMLELFRENIVSIEEVRATLNLGGDAETIAELKALQNAKYQSAINSMTQDAGVSQTSEGNDKSEKATEDKSVDDNTKEKSKEVKEKNAKNGI